MICKRFHSVKSFDLNSQSYTEGDQSKFCYLSSPWISDSILTESLLSQLHLTNDVMTARNIFQFATRLDSLNVTDMEFGPLIGLILFTPGNFSLFFYILKISIVW